MDVNQIKSEFLKKNDVMLTLIEHITPVLSPPIFSIC